MKMGVFTSPPPPTPLSPFPLASSSPVLPLNPNPNFYLQHHHSSILIRRRTPGFLIMTSATSAAAAQQVDRSKSTRSTSIALEDSKSTRLVTFLGKGGSGKTTSAVLAAKYYADSGLNTCLVVHSQDPSAEYLLGCKIGTSPTLCKKNLSAIRLETTKMLLEPLNQLKQADARLKLTQGVLEGVVGEELGVLPGMDSIFTALELSKMVGLLRTTAAKRSQPVKKIDVVVYDGISNEETLRMIGMTERASWYLKYLRNMAEKTDIGRLTAPSLLRLVDEAIMLDGAGSGFSANMSAQIWDDLERILERASVVFADPSKFSCYLVLNPDSLASMKSALRYWGCAIQSGAQVSGVVGFAPPTSSSESAEMIKKSVAPLPFAFMPYISTNSLIDWEGVSLTQDAQNLLAASNCSKFQSSVQFDQTKKSVTLFMPGFDKSDIKLYQYREGLELLVEAGDQRRVIHLPPKIQGKVGGAKLTDKSLVIRMQ